MSCPSKVSLKTEGLRLLATMTIFDGSQFGWPSSGTPASVIIYIDSKQENKHLVVQGVGEGDL